MIECGDDEECKPIKECDRESKMLANGRIDSLKFCGLWLRSVRKVH